MTHFKDVLETILEEYARRNSEGEFDTWEETDAFVNEKAEVLLAYVKEEPVSEELEKAADKYSNHDYNYFDVLVTEYDGTEHWMDDKVFIKDAFIEGAKWKEQQFETERLKHCELKKEPISEELEEAAFDYAEACKYDGGEKLLCVEHFKTGAQWQKEQMMAKAIDAEVLENFDGKVIEYDETLLEEKLSNCNVFDKVKVIVIKED